MTKAFGHGGDIYTEGLLKGIELIDFSSNINPKGLPLSFKTQLEKASQQLTRYPDYQYRLCKGAIVQYIKETYNVNFNEENLILGNGAAEIIDLVTKIFNSIVIAVPSFSEYEERAMIHKNHIIYSYLKHDMTYDYEDLYEKVSKAEALILGNPNNPTGNIIDKGKFKDILNYCEAEKKIVIIDEAFVEFTGDNHDSLMDFVDKYNCLFIIRALTKFFAMPGIRLGYGVSKNYRLLDSLKSYQIPWNINAFAELAAEVVLKDKEYIDESIKWIMEERIRFIDNLRKIPIFEKVYNTESNFVLCKLKKYSDGEFYKLLMAKGIAIRKASNFRGLDDKYIRLAIKDQDLNDKLLKVLSDISQEAII